MGFVIVYLRSRNSRLKVLGRYPTETLKFSTTMAEVRVKRRILLCLENVSTRSVDDRNIEVYMMV